MEGCGGIIVSVSLHVHFSFVVFLLLLVVVVVVVVVSGGGVIVVVGVVVCNGEEIFVISGLRLWLKTPCLLTLNHKQVILS